jgi:hypothetical protein
VLNSFAASGFSRASNRRRLKAGVRSYVFEHLPTATTVEALEALLPWNVRPILEVRRKRREMALRAAAAT